jgi:hypothetical protein
LAIVRDLIRVGFRTRAQIIAEIYFYGDNLSLSGIVNFKLTPTPNRLIRHDDFPPLSEKILDILGNSSRSDGKTRPDS